MGLVRGAAAMVGRPGPGSSFVAESGGRGVRAAVSVAKESVPAPAVAGTGTVSLGPPGGGQTAALVFSRRFLR